MAFMNDSDTKITVSGAHSGKDREEQEVIDTWVTGLFKVFLVSGLFQALCFMSGAVAIYFLFT